MEYTIIYVLLVSLTVYAMNYVVYYIILCPLGWLYSISAISHSRHQIKLSFEFSLFWINAGMNNWAEMRLHLVFESIFS